MNRNKHDQHRKKKNPQKPISSSITLLTRMYSQNI